MKDLNGHIIDVTEYHYKIPASGVLHSIAGVLV